MGQFPKTLAGVIKVQRLGCAAKTIFDQGPQPDGPIDDDEDFLSPSHTATQRLLLHGSPEPRRVAPVCAQNPPSPTQPFAAHSFCILAQAAVRSVRAQLA